MAGRQRRPPRSRFTASGTTRRNASFRCLTDDQTESALSVQVPAPQATKGTPSLSLTPPSVAPGRPEDLVAPEPTTALEDETASRLLR